MYKCKQSCKQQQQQHDPPTSVANLQEHWLNGDKELLSEGFLSDFSIKCGEDEYKVHKYILVRMSNYFRNMFRHNVKETQENCIILKEEDASNVKMMIEHIYWRTYETRPDWHQQYTLHQWGALNVFADKYEMPLLAIQSTEGFVGSFCELCLQSKHREAHDVLRKTLTATSSASNKDFYVRMAVIWASWLSAMRRELGEDDVREFLQDRSNFSALVILEPMNQM